MTASRAPRPELKGRPPLRACPDDFDVMFVEQGRQECEDWYRASRRTINRWMVERGEVRLIKARASYVAHQRAAGDWLTRSSRMVDSRPVKAPRAEHSIRDRRKVSFILARHAAQYLRVVRNGGWIVSPTPQGDWRVGTRRLSPAQMLDLAVAKGFIFDEREYR